MKYSFNFEDASQIFVGAFALAVPISFSEEAWRLGETLPILNLLVLFTLSVVFLTLYTFENVFQRNVSERKLVFILRIVVAYFMTAMVVMLVLFCINKLPLLSANNLEEEIQSDIESQGDPCLTRLLVGDTSFFENEKSAAHFLNYICMQYLRTKKQHDALVSGAIGENSEQIIRCANLIRIVFSSKLAANLYANRSDYKLVVAKNDSDIPFITCDQPVVNFLDTRLDSSEETKEFGLYYPISPNLAVFLVKNEIFGSVKEMNFDQLSVEEFNQITLNASYEQVYSSSEKQLRDLALKTKT